MTKVWVVPYTRGWSYDLTAQALQRYLGMDVRIAYDTDVAAGALATWDADVVLDMWWKGTLNWRYKTRTVRQVSSHRWGRPGKYGLGPRKTPIQLTEGCGAVVVPSRRLLTTLSGSARCPVTVAPKGFHPELMWNQGRRRRTGDLEVCWAGSSEHADKRFGRVTAAWPNVRAADACLTQREMGDFYNSADVLVVASIAEGDPRPLIEGMACGLFPVCTDVGIVPELVTHMENGYILRDVKELSTALAWCMANRGRVLEGGQVNAERMLATRTWAHVAPRWRQALESVIRSAT